VLASATPATASPMVGAYILLIFEVRSGIGRGLHGWRGSCINLGTPVSTVPVFPSLCTILSTRAIRARSRTGSGKDHPAVVGSIHMYTDPFGPAADGVALANTDLNVCTVSLSLSCKEAEKEYQNENICLFHVTSLYSSSFFQKDIEKKNKKEEIFYILFDKKERKEKSKEMLYRINKCVVQDGSRQFFSKKHTPSPYTNSLYTHCVFCFPLSCVCVCVLCLWSS
jgi:hypothetical protein